LCSLPSLMASELETESTCVSPLLLLDVEERLGLELESELPEEVMFQLLVVWLRCIFFDCFMLSRNTIFEVELRSICTLVVLAEIKLNPDSYQHTPLIYYLKCTFLY
jgi:hypothetical protein